jgi:hypothetical protein
LEHLLDLRPVERLVGFLRRVAVEMVNDELLFEGSEPFLTTLGKGKVRKEEPRSHTEQDSDETLDDEQLKAT